MELFKNMEANDNENLNEIEIPIQVTIMIIINYATNFVKMLKKEMMKVNNTKDRNTNIIIKI